MDLRTIDASDGPTEAHVALPPAGTGPGVLMFMDAIGIRPQLVGMAERIAAWGYVVLLPNLFYRSGSVAELMPTTDLRQPGARDALFATIPPRMQELTTERALADIDAYLSVLQGIDGVAGTRVGTVGYCMGAGLVIRAAGRHPDVVAAAAGFHGGGLVTDQPDSPHLSLATATADFVFGHADNDSSLPPAAVDALGVALGAAGLTATNTVYPDAPHGFSMADTSMYQEAGAERSFGELQALLARTLI